jgi:cytochrome c
LHRVNGPLQRPFARGEDIYAQQYATCHGDCGMGDGPAGKVLDPAPAPMGLFCE